MPCRSRTIQWFHRNRNFKYLHWWVISSPNKNVFPLQKRSPTVRALNPIYRLRCLRTLKDVYHDCTMHIPQDRLWWEHLTVSNSWQLTLYSQSLSTHITGQSLPCSIDHLLFCIFYSVISMIGNISWHQSMDKMLFGLLSPKRHLLGKQFCIVDFLIVSCKWCSWGWLVWPVIAWCLQ